MIYKNNDIKNNRIQYQKLIFSLVLIIYFAGICTGCTFAFKNSQNLTFVQKVTVIENITKLEKTAFLALSVRYFVRDCLMFCMVLVFKYSGILKGMCLTIPFVTAVQNSCIYATVIYENKIGIFNLFFHYILKDTSVIFILLIYTYIIINEIVSNKDYPRSDVKKLVVYLIAISFIYIIDITVKTMLYPF